MLIKCPECGKEISDKAQSCPNCGLPASEFSTMLIEEEMEKDVDAANIAMPQAEQTVDEDNKRSNTHIKQFLIAYIAVSVFLAVVISGINYSIEQLTDDKENGTSYKSQTETSITGTSDIDFALHDDAEVWVCAVDAVKRELKAPSTAKFCKYTEATITDLGNGKYQAEGWVDAENSYGATLRQKFIVTYTATGSGYKNPDVIFW